MIDGTNSYNNNLKFNGGGYSTGSASTNLRDIKFTINPNPSILHEKLYASGFSEGQKLYQNQKIRLINKPELFALAFADGDVNTIRLVSDLSFWSYTKNFTKESISNRQTNRYNYTAGALQDMVIDGNGHKADFANHTFTRRGNVKTTVENIDMWGSNFYGPIKNEDSGSLTFRNIEYTGPQLVNAAGASTIIGGNKVTINGGQTYQNPIIGASNVPEGTIYSPEGAVTASGSSSITGSNQENMEVKDLTFEEGVVFTGSTYNATVLNTSGQVNIGKNATINLMPRGFTNSASAGSNGIASGINIGSGSLNLKPGSQLNIKPQASEYNNPNQILSNALYVKGNVNVDNAAISITMDGPISTLGAVELSGGNINIQNEGQFLVYAKNLGTSSGNLIDLASNNLNINTQSVFGVKIEDGSGNINLINGNNLTIDSPGPKEFTLGNEKGFGVLLSRGSNTASNTRLINGSGNLIANNVGILRNNNTKSAYSTLNINLSGGNVRGTGMDSGSEQTVWNYSPTADKNILLTNVPDIKLGDVKLNAKEDGTGYELVGIVNTIGSDSQYNLTKNPIYLRLSSDKNNSIISQDKSDGLNQYSQKLDENTAGVLKTSGSDYSLPFTIDLGNINPINYSNKIYGHFVSADRAVNFNTGSNNAVLELQARADAYSDFAKGQKDDLRANSGNVVYKNAYNSTYDAINPEIQAQKDYIGKGTPNANRYTNDSRYRDAYDGFSTAAKGYSMNDNPSSEYRNSYNTVKDAQHGREAYLFNKEITSDNQNNLNFMLGYTTTKAMLSSDDTKISTEPAAVYTQNVIQGMEDYLNNKSDTNSNASYSFGYTEFKAGYENVNSDISNTDIYKYAAQISKQRQKGANQYYENPSLSNEEINQLSSTEKDGYIGTKSGVADGNVAAINGQPKANLTGTSKTYQDAYNIAYDKAKEARKGAEAALDNPNQEPNGNA
ncbi:hypothetical protein, partial [Holzapfeliella floricola]|uniref:hypothetical protein n=1 Tax=Holzapfeliella floricola TaxID=679249 RepID=UPI001A93048E